MPVSRGGDPERMGNMPKKSQGFNRYDSDMQMFVEEVKIPNLGHLRFLRWQVENGQLEHPPIGPSSGEYAKKNSQVPPAEVQTSFLSIASEKVTSQKQIAPPSFILKATPGKEQETKDFYTRRLSAWLGLSVNPTASDFERKLAGKAAYSSFQALVRLGHHDHAVAVKEMAIEALNARKQ